MPITLPSLTERLDDKFLTTWYEIRPEAADNVLEASVIWTLLKEKGCLKPQTGGRFITRTVRYEVPGLKWVQKGSTFSQGETETETMAMWTWRYFSGHVQRSIFDDQINSGPSKIKDYVRDRIASAREGLTQSIEKILVRGYDDLTALIAAGAIAETYVHPTDGAPMMQGLNDLVPPYDYANSAFVVSGNYGGIARCSAYAANSIGVYCPNKASATNSFWGPRYLPLTKPFEINLVSDLNKLYDTVHNNQSPPDTILLTLKLFQIYKEIALDMTQLVMDVKSRAADLGYEVLKFRGKSLTWSPNIGITYDGTEYNQVLMLNSQYMDVVYDPGLWFDATKWKDIPLQGERIMHILSAANIVSDQLRRHGRAYETA